MMLNIISRFVDVVFPPRPTDICIRSCTPERISALYVPGAYEQCQFVTHYEKPIVQALIKENKYYRNQKAAIFLASLLERWLRSNLPQRQLVLIPVPLSKKRVRERGYNQVLEILAHMQKNDLYEVRTDIISRPTHTKPQTSLARSERLLNLKDAIVCKSTISDYAGKTVVIVDDVVTTGATLAAARASLAPHIPSTTVICIALAH
jgi:ComF family protein